MTVEKLQDVARQSGMSSGEALLVLGSEAGREMETILGRAVTRLIPFGRMLADWRSQLNRVSLTTLFDQVMLDTGYEAYIKDDGGEDVDRWANVLGLRQVLLEYEDRGLTEFLEAMALVADQDTLPETLDAPTMMTLHTAKGLEFPQVFIIGLDELYLPHSRSGMIPKRWRRKGGCSMSV